MALSRGHSTAADGTFSAGGAIAWDAAHAVSGVTSGGIPYFSSTTAEASSGLLTASAILLGGGAGAAPTALGSLGTTTTILHGNAAGAPTFGAVSLTADVSGILPTANGGTGIAYFTAAGPTVARVYTFPDAAASISILGAETWTGDKTMAENVGLVLDAALSADGKYSGIVEAGTAGAALAFGELCYLQTADSRWEKSQAAAAQIATANLKLGMCVLAAAGDGSATTMLLFGKIRADSLFPTMTIGAPAYMSAATAGVITSTAPTGTTDFTVRKVGFANTADELFFNPSNDYVTLA